jgi:cyclophilin family peptidyl-prolyl cis-trans isomerase
MKKIFWSLSFLLTAGLSFAQSRQVLLETTEGNIRIELSDLTPVHRDNFVRLVNEHFYDSLLFHRVIKDFMIQAGDPDSRHAEPGVSLGEGDVGYTLEPEFRVPQLFHQRGMVAMAREGDDANPGRRSSGSHFYIVWGKTFSTIDIENIQQRLDAQTNHTVKMTPEMIQAYRHTGGTPHLDGQYTVFGRVTEGLDVVERIQKTFTDDYDRPVDDVRIIRATCNELPAPKRLGNRLYNPDPAPVVSGDRLYVFTGHDLDTATYFRMPDWQVFSTTDMEHWTDHGVVLTTANFKWARQGDNAWASQAIERNGKWYWYVAAEDTTRHLHGIGVAVADRPEGPWADAIGKPLIPGGWGFIDPTVFIDDDGQAWLFWGNNGCWYAKLNEDMVSIDTTFADHGICDMRSMLDDEAQFGPQCMKMDYQLHKRVMKTGFEEAPWLYKIGDTYFLEYAAGGVPEHWAYSTAKSIHGPWHYEGRITDESPGSFTIHGGTVDFKGKSYLFYHDGIPSGGNGFRRTAAYREFQRLKDGRIPKIDIQPK